MFDKEEPLRQFTHDREETFEAVHDESARMSPKICLATTPCTIVPFTDPVILGRFVYHCHAVDHEDKGMMGVVEVTA
jgi:hypothetical protein